MPESDSEPDCALPELAPLCDPVCDPDVPLSLPDWLPESELKALYDEHEPDIRELLFSLYDVFEMKQGEQRSEIERGAGNDR